MLIDRRQPVFVYLMLIDDVPLGVYHGPQLVFDAAHRYMAAAGAWTQSRPNRWWDNLGRKLEVVPWEVQ